MYICFSTAKLASPHYKNVLVEMRLNHFFLLLLCHVPQNGCHGFSHYCSLEVFTTGCTLAALLFCCFRPEVIAHVFHFTGDSRPILLWKPQSICRVSISIISVCTKLKTHVGTALTFSHSYEKLKNLCSCRAAFNVELTQSIQY